MLEISGQLEKISTTKDGGWMVQFALPGDANTGLAVAALATLRESNLTLTIDDQPRP